MVGEILDWIVHAKIVKHTLLSIEILGRKRNLEQPGNFRHPVSSICFCLTIWQFLSTACQRYQTRNQAVFDARNIQKITTCKYIILRRLENILNIITRMVFHQLPCTFYLYIHWDTLNFTNETEIRSNRLVKLMSPLN